MVIVVEASRNGDEQQQQSETQFCCLVGFLRWRFHSFSLRSSKSKVTSDFSSLFFPSDHTYRASKAAFHCKCLKGQLTPISNTHICFSLSCPVLEILGGEFTVSKEAYMAIKRKPSMFASYHSVMSVSLCLWIGTS